MADIPYGLDYPEGPWPAGEVPPGEDGEASPMEPGVRRVKVTWASSIEPEPVVWAWEETGRGRIPAGSLSIAAGREATGKSSFGIWLASQISRGTLPGNLRGKPRRVLYVAVEDSWKYTLVPRAMAAKADLGMIGRFQVVTTTFDDRRETSLTLSLPHDNQLLSDTIAAHDVGLVVIDPLLSVIGSTINSHNTREVRDALDPLAGIADETGAVILGIAHFNKSSGTDAAGLISGAHAFRDVPRSLFGFARDYENQTRVMSQVKNSLGRDDLPSRTYNIESVTIDTAKGPAETGRFVFTGETDRTVADVLRDSYSRSDGGGRQSADQFIAAYLNGAGGEAPANQVIAAGISNGYNEGTLKNARRKVADSKSTGFADKTHIWVLLRHEDHAVGHVGHTIPPALPTCSTHDLRGASGESTDRLPPGAPSQVSDRVRSILAGVTAAQSA